MQRTPSHAPDYEPRHEIGVERIRSSDYVAAPHILCGITEGEDQCL
jgi:hypothetical protein